MLSLFMALIGFPIGIVLDALIDRLAIAAYDDDEDIDAASASPAPSLHAEAGSLLVEHGPEHAWRRRLLTVGATAGLFAIAGARYDHAGQLALVSAYICALLVCAATDLLSYRVPNAITYPAIVGTLIAGALMPGAHIANVLAGGALAGGVLLVPAIFTGGVGMGMGDVKLATFVGLALGFALLPPALLLMALGGGVVASVLLLSGLRKRGEPIPYAPFIAGGALITLLWQGVAFTSLT